MCASRIRYVDDGGGLVFQANFDSDFSGELTSTDRVMISSWIIAGNVLR